MAPRLLLTSAVNAKPPASSSLHSQGEVGAIWGAIRLGRQVQDAVRGGWAWCSGKLAEHGALAWEVSEGQKSALTSVLQCRNSDSLVAQEL